MLQIGCICSLLPVVSAKASAVDPALVGSWQLVVPNPNHGLRWLWDIRADGNYSLHAEGQTSIPLHSGTMKAKKGKYSLKSTAIDWIDTGTYDVSTGFLRSSGKLGDAWWKRAEGSPEPPGPGKASVTAIPANLKAAAPSLPYAAAMNAAVATHSFVLGFFHGKGPHTDHLISVLRESILNDPVIADQLIFADADVASKEAVAAARRFQVTQWPSMYVFTVRPPADNPHTAIFGERYGDLDTKTVHDFVLSAMCAAYRFPKATLEVPVQGEALKATCTPMLMPPDITTPVLDPPALPPLVPARGPVKPAKR